MRLLLVATALLMVSGCAAVQQQRVADAESAYVAKRDVCSASATTNIARQQCVSDERDRVYAAAGMDSDLIGSLRATRLSLAQRLDNGEITQVDADAEYAMANSRAISEQQNRNLQRQAIATQRSAAINNALRTFQATQPPPPRTTNCTSRVVFGTLQTTCN